MRDHGKASAEIDPVSLVARLWLRLLAVVLAIFSRHLSNIINYPINLPAWIVGVTEFNVLLQTLF